MHPRTFERSSLSAYFILNRILQRDFDVTPFEGWKGRTPNIQFFKVWDCLTKVSIPEPKKRKIDPKTVDAIFIRYALNSNINRFLVVNSEISEISKTPSLKLEMLSNLKISFLLNQESQVILLVLLLSLIFFLLVLLLLLILNQKRARELELSHPLVKTSLPIL